MVPVIYDRSPKTPAALWKVRMAILLGMATCFILGVMWCYFMLQSVPQTGPAPSLEDALEHGQIAIIPFVAVLSESAPDLLWLGTVTNVFMLVSITVSFVTMSTAMKHVLDGYLESLMSSSRACLRSLFHRLRTRCGVRGTWIIGAAPIYLIGFGLVLVVALNNPRSFVTMMEVVTSASLNIEAGLCVALMVPLSQRRHPEAKPTVGLHRCFYPWWILVSVYFIGAVIYDIINVILRNVS